MCVSVCANSDLLFRSGDTTSPWGGGRNMLTRSVSLVLIDQLCRNKANKVFGLLDVAEGVEFACSKFIFFS